MLILFSHDLLWTMWVRIVLWVYLLSTSFHCVLLVSVTAIKCSLCSSSRLTVFPRQTLKSVKQFINETITDRVPFKLISISEDVSSYLTIIFARKYKLNQQKGFKNSSHIHVVNEHNYIRMIEQQNKVSQFIFEITSVNIKLKGFLIFPRI